MSSVSIPSDLPATHQPSPIAYPQGLPIGPAWGEENEGSEGVRVSSLMHALRRQWLPALGLGILLATIVAALLWLVIPVEYQATAVLRINRDETFGTRRYGTINDYMVYKETQANLLKSSFVVMAALRDNDISQLPMVKYDGLNRQRLRPVAWLVDEIKVDLAGGSELIRVRLKGESKDQTEKLLNAVVEAYQAEIVNKERLEKVDMLNKLRKRYRTNYEDIKRKSDEVSNLARQLGTLDDKMIAAQQQVRLQELHGAKNEFDRLSREYNSAVGELSLMQLQAQLGNEEPSEFAIEDELERDPAFYQLRAAIRQIKDELESMAAYMNPGSGPMVQLEQTLAQYQRKEAKLREELTPRVVARLKASDGLSDREKRDAQILQRQQCQNLYLQLSNAGEVYQSKLEAVKEIGGFSGELDARMGELAGLRANTQKIRADMQALEIELEQDNRVSVIQRASTPNDSNWKLKLSEVIGAWILTLAGVVAAVAFWDYLGKRVNDSEDLTRATIKVVGTLPSIQQNGYFSFLKLGRSALEKAIQVSVDGIRTALLYNREKKSRVVIITSATGSEGRSTVASQLAVSMARSGKRTLLIDGDLRSPQQHEIFGVQPRGGLSELLRGEQTADQAILPTTVEDVWLLAAGRCDQFALQGLSGDPVRELFRNLRERFDMIIIDSSPVLTSTEVLLLGQQADTALLSVRRDVSQLPKVNAASDRLTSVGIHVLGAVVNGAGVEMRRGEIGVAEVPQEEQQPALTNA